MTCTVSAVIYRFFPLLCWVLQEWFTDFTWFHQFSNVRIRPHQVAPSLMISWDLSERACWKCFHVHVSVCKCGVEQVNVTWHWSTGGDESSIEIFTAGIHGNHTNKHTPLPRLGPSPIPDIQRYTNTHCYYPAVTYLTGSGFLCLLFSLLPMSFKNSSHYLS